MGGYQRGKSALAQDSSIEMIESLFDDFGCVHTWISKEIGHGCGKDRFGLGDEDQDEACCKDFFG
jgi:hypothetical protein